jgi:hypothetical protein
VAKEEDKAGSRSVAKEEDTARSTAVAKEDESEGHFEAVAKEEDKAGSAVWSRRTIARYVACPWRTSCRRTRRTRWRRRTSRTRTDTPAWVRPYPGSGRR